jgi:hypothetical protein
LLIDTPTIQEDGSASKLPHPNAQALHPKDPLQLEAATLHLMRSFKSATQALALHPKDPLIRSFKSAIQRTKTKFATVAHQAQIKVARQ